MALQIISSAKIGARHRSRTGTNRRKKTAFKIGNPQTLLILAVVFVIFAAFAYKISPQYVRKNLAALTYSGWDKVIYSGDLDAPLFQASDRSCLEYAKEIAYGRDSSSNDIELMPDQWHAAAYRLNCGDGTRVDFSKYATLEFDIKSDARVTSSHDFNLVSYYGTSKTVNLLNYVAGGVIDETWRTVRIPVADLQTASYNLNSIDTMYFGTEQSGRVYFVDDIILRKNATVPPSTATQPGSTVTTGTTNTTGTTGSNTTTVTGQTGQGTVTVVPSQDSTKPAPVQAAKPVSIADKTFLDNLFDSIKNVVAPPPQTQGVAGDTYDQDEVDLAHKDGQWLYAENSTYISLNFTQKYDTGKIKDSAKYSITSADDSAYSRALHPQFVGYRFKTIYAPTIRTTDLIVAYRVFLKVPKTLVSGKTYTVTVGDIGISAKPFTFTMNDANFNPNIKVNQIGYLTASKKIGYVGQYMGTGGPMPFALPSFTVKDLSGNTAYAGTAALRNVDEDNTGQSVYELDFSSLKTPGYYKLYVPGVGTSYSFRISDDVYNQVSVVALKGALNQRASTALTTDYTRFAHGAGHTNDAYVMSTNPVPSWFRARFDSQGDTHLRDTSGQRYYFPTSLGGQYINTTKGHYDAGDYGKYVVNGSLFVGNILTAYDAFGSRLARDNMQIPESGNGIPDILDEAKWELDWLENMQDPNDGGVFCIVKPDGAVEYYENRKIDAPSPSKRLLYAKDTTCTAHYAAALAKAAVSKQMNQYFPGDVGRYLEKSKKAWAFLEAHPGYLGWHHYGVKDEYDTDKSMDERVWAATELFAATGENKYLAFVNVHAKPEYEHWGWNTLFEASGQADYACAFMERAGMESLRQRCISEIVKAADSHVIDSNNRAYRLSMSDAPLNYRDYTYFFPQERIIQLLVANSLKPNSAYLDTALRNWDYILGENPVGYSFVTGLGAHRFREVVSTESVYDDIDAPVSGLPIGMGNNFGYLEVYGSKLAQLYPPNNGGSRDSKVSYPLLGQVYDGWNIGVEFTVPEISENIVSAAYFSSASSGNSRPSVSVSADKVTGAVPLTVKFDAHGSDSDGRVVSYFWDFDDESYSSVENPTHTFADPYRVYRVTVTATDDKGAEAYRTIEIKTNPATYAFASAAYSADASTVALFDFDSSLADSAGKSVFAQSPGSSASLSSENVLWMRSPKGKALKLDRVTDEVKLDIPRKSVFPTSLSTAVIEAKIYVDTHLSYDARNATMFALSQGDSRGVGLYDAMYVDGTHVKVMDGYDRQEKMLSSSEIKVLQGAGTMQDKTWYNIKFVVGPSKTELYINDKKVRESATVPHFAASDQPLTLTIGGFKGFVDEVRITR